MSDSVEGTGFMERFPLHASECRSGQTALSSPYLGIEIISLPIFHLSHEIDEVRRSNPERVLRDRRETEGQ